MPRACQVLAAQPFSVMLGAKLLALDLGHAEVAVPKGANVGQRNGIAQGDLIAFLADAAVTLPPDPSAARGADRRSGHARRACS